MNFYYHPILGLQYTYLGNEIILDINCIPNDLKIDEFIHKWKEYASKTGISLVNPQAIEIRPIITEYKL